MLLLISPAVWCKWHHTHQERIMPDVLLNLISVCVTKVPCHVQQCGRQVEMLALWLFVLNSNVRSLK